MKLDYKKKYKSEIVICWSMLLTFIIIYGFFSIFTRINNFNVNNLTNEVAILNTNLGKLDGINNELHALNNYIYNNLSYELDSFGQTFNNSLNILHSILYKTNTIESQVAMQQNPNVNPNINQDF